MAVGPNQASDSQASAGTLAACRRRDTGGEETFPQRSSSSSSNSNSNDFEAVLGK